METGRNRWEPDMMPTGKPGRPKREVQGIPQDLIDMEAKRALAVWQKAIAEGGDDFERMMEEA